ncbi:2-keto-4-pentenoate hydratase [Microbacterium sp. RD1]|uniref:2-keto-4-pentenoate hydratase n=1 Tax=Microbacterium sp. RD1 TaxID=3457313 RepID=UPI003FA54A3C
MIDDSQVHEAAAALFSAYETGAAIAPLSETYPGLTVDDAYAIQSAQIAAWTAEGRAIWGYKVGLTSRAMQQQLGVDQPDYGFLVDGMAYPDGGEVALDHFLAARVEPEIAFVLGRDLRGPGLTADDARAAVEAVVASIEIIDSRIADWRITLPDTIADNASSAGAVIGSVRLPVEDVDLAALTVTLSRDGEKIAEGTGAAVMGSPLNALTWLANKLGEYGVTLTAGSIVLPGSVCAAAPVSTGDLISADFGPLGTVGIRFS